MRSSDAAHAAEAVHAALKEGLHTGGKALANVRVLGAALQERFADVSEPVDERLLARTVETLKELQVQVGSMVTQLESATLSQRRVRVRPDRSTETTDEESNPEAPSVRTRPSRPRLHGD